MSFKLVQLLTQEGVVTEDELELLEERREEEGDKGLTLDADICLGGHCSPSEMNEYLATALKKAAVTDADLAQVDLPALVEMWPAEEAHTHNMCPISWDEEIEELRLATPLPWSKKTVKELIASSEQSLAISPISQIHFVQLMQQAYGDDIPELLVESAEKWPLPTPAPESAQEGSEEAPADEAAEQPAAEDSSAADSAVASSEESDAEAAADAAGPEESAASEEAAPTEDAAPEATAAESDEPKAAEASDEADEASQAADDSSAAEAQAAEAPEPEEDAAPKDASAEATPSEEDASEEASSADKDAEVAAKKAKEDGNKAMEAFLGSPDDLLDSLFDSMGDVNAMTMFPPLPEVKKADRPPVKSSYDDDEEEEKIEPGASVAALDAMVGSVSAMDLDAVLSSSLDDSLDLGSLGITSKEKEAPKATEAAAADGDADAQTGPDAPESQDAPAADASPASEAAASEPSTPSEDAAEEVAPPVKMSIGEVEALLETAQSRDAVLELGLFFAAGISDQAAVFMLPKGRAVGHYLHGAESLQSVFRSFAIPTDGDTIFRKIRDSLVPYSGPIPSTKDDRFFFALFDPVPHKVYFFPVRIRGRNIATIYCHQHHEDLDAEVFESLIRCAHKVAAALERVIIAIKQKNQEEDPEDILHILESLRENDSERYQGLVEPYRPEDDDDDFMFEEPVMLQTAPVPAPEPTPEPTPEPAPAEPEPAPESATVTMEPVAEDAVPTTDTAVTAEPDADEATTDEPVAEPSNDEGKEEATAAPAGATVEFSSEAADEPAADAMPYQGTDEASAAPMTQEYSSLRDEAAASDDAVQASDDAAADEPPPAADAPTTQSPETVEFSSVPMATTADSDEPVVTLDTPKAVAEEEPQAVADDAPKAESTPVTFLAAAGEVPGPTNNHISVIRSADGMIMGAEVVSPYTHRDGALVSSSPTLRDAPFLGVLRQHNVAIPEGDVLARATVDVIDRSIQSVFARVFDMPADIGKAPQTPPPPPSGASEESEAKAATPPPPPTSSGTFDASVLSFQSLPKAFVLTKDESSKGLPPLSDELQELRGRLLAEDSNEEALRELLQRPTHELIVVLLHAFPGGLDRADIQNDGSVSFAQMDTPGGRIWNTLLDYPGETSACIAALLSHEDRHIRLMALLMLRQLPSEHLLPYLLRMLLDPDPAIVRSVRKQLTRVRGSLELAELFEWLRYQLNDELPEQAEEAIKILREARDPNAVPELIEFLSTKNKQLEALAIEALTDLTRQPSMSQRKWRKWWKKTGSQSDRIDWLVAGIQQKDMKIADAAIHELRELTGLNFGFDPNAAKRQRQAAIQQWKAWYKQRG